MRKVIVTSSILLVGMVTSWYVDLWHRPVERIDELIGQNLDYAYKIYFQTDPDKHYKVNINENLNEFNGGILNKTEFLTDAVVHVFTWEYTTHKKTIWVGHTEIMQSEVIDAIRYTNTVRF